MRGDGAGWRTPDPYPLDTDLNDPVGHDPVLAGSSSGGDLSLTAIEELAATDPESARRLAIVAADRAVDADRVVLLAAAAEASIRVGAMADACSLFDTAARLATRTQHRAAPGLHVRHAAMMAATGDSAAALVALDVAEPMLGDERWRAWDQRGVVLHWIGRSDEAVMWFDRAEPLASAAGDALAVAKVMMNRALARAHIGDLVSAAVDARSAEATCRAIGEATLAAHFLHNRGWIAARAGELAEGWRLMHDAAQEPSWTSPPVVLADRAELAHAAGLLDEAETLAEAAWADQTAAGDSHGSAGTTLLRARIALDLSRGEIAVALAGDAKEMLAAQGRRQLAGSAASVQIDAARLRASQIGGTDGARYAREAIRELGAAIRDVEIHPWTAVRLDGLITAGELHLLAGSDQEAGRLLTLAEVETAGGLVGGARRHVAAALARRARKEPGELAQLEAAWARLVAARSAPRVQDLSGGWGDMARLLSRVAVVPSLQRGDAETAISWLERLRPGPVLAAPDPDLEDAAANLRRLWASSRSGGDDFDPDDEPLFAVAERALEARLVDRARLLDGTSSTALPSTAAALAAGATGEVGLVWLIALAAGAWVVSLTRDDARVEAVDRGALLANTARLRSMLTFGEPEWPAAARELDRLLGVEGWPHRPVVIPVGDSVEDLCVGSLPSLRDRAHRLCASGGHWAATRRPPVIDTVTVACTDVEGGGIELDRLSSIWPAATLLSGDAASAARVQEAFGSDDLVHVAAHGRIRRDNPLLSVLECADGPVYGYELARRERAPSILVLWSCGLGGLRAPAELGLAGWSTLLAARGCNAVVAASGPLPSGPAPELAAQLHRGLAARRPVADVLAGLRGASVGDEDACRAAAMLSVFGGG